MTSNLIPTALRDEVERDLQVVRPLSPAWCRSLIVATVVAVVITTALLVIKLELRPDLGDMPMWLGWGASCLELITGIFLVGLALREAVPGGALPTGGAHSAIGTGVVLQMAVGVVTWLHSPGTAMGNDWLATSVVCLRRESSMVVPIFIVTLWLVFRALPLRASMAGMLGGCGAAVAGDAIMHLLCPMSDLRHVLVWHTGAIVGFIALGWLIGLLWARIRWR